MVKANTGSQQEDKNADYTYSTTKVSFCTKVSVDDGVVIVSDFFIQFLRVLNRYRDVQWRRKMIFG